MGVRRYGFALDGADYKVRIDPRQANQGADVAFARRGADDSAMQNPAGDRSSAQALRLMRLIAGIVEQDAEQYGASAYKWSGQTRGHDELYAAMLRRYGAPEGYEAQLTQPQLRRVGQ